MSPFLNLFRRGDGSTADSAGRTSTPQDWITVFSVIEEDLNHLLKPAVGLNLTQARFLYEVSFRRDENLLGKISSRLMLQANTASAVCKTLHSLTYIDVYRPQENKRVQCVTVTDEGKGALQKIYGVYEEYYRQLKKVLTRDQINTVCAVTRYSAQAQGADYSTETTAYAKTAELVAGSAFVLARLALLGKKYGYSATQIRILACIAGFDTPQRTGTVAARLGLLPNVASINIGPLEKDALLERIPDDVDRRAKRLALTEEGRALFVALASDFEPLITAPTRYLLAAPRPLTTQLFPVKHPKTTKRDS